MGALEERLAEALEQQTATSEILRVISRSPSDLQPVLAAVVLNASRLCGAANVSLYRVEGTLMRKVAEEGAELTSLRVNETRPITRTSISGRAIIERTTIYVPDHQAAEAAREYPDARRNTGIRTTIGIPLLRDGIALGAFTAYRTESRPFAEHEIALLRTFADQAAIAIENVRLFTELQGKNRDLATALDQQTATSEILRAISRSPTDVQPVFNTVVQSGLRLLGGYSATIMLLRDDARLDLVAYTSTSAEAVASLVHAFPMPLRRIPAGERAVHERRAHAVEDIESAPDATDVMRETGRARGWRSNLVVPMIRDDLAIGLISITRREPGPFPADQIALLETFAAQAVIAIENVRLFKELQASNRDLTTALERRTTAKALGLTIPKSLLLRADTVRPWESRIRMIG